MRRRAGEEPTATAYWRSLFLDIFRYYDRLGMLLFAAIVPDTYISLRLTFGRNGFLIPRIFRL